MTIRCLKLCIGHYIFRTGFSKRIIDRNGALLKFQKVRPFSIGAKYKLIDIVKKDYGITAGLVKVSIENQEIYDDEKYWTISTEINLEDGMMRNINYNGRLSPFVLNSNNFPTYFISEMCNHYFTAADDESALLIYELGEQ